MSEEKIEPERSDSSSIKVTCNSKGQFTHEIKIYFDNQNENSSDVVKKINSIEQELQEKFPIKRQIKIEKRDILQKKSKIMPVQQGMNYQILNILIVKQK